MKSVTSAFLVLLSLSGSGLAQARPILVGWADNGPRTTSELHTQDVLSNCAKAARLCQTKLQSVTQAFAGGTAYDPRRHAVFASDGARFELIDVATCQSLCTAPAQLMNSSATVSGLAMIDGGRRLLQLETASGYAGLRSYDARTCPPTPLRDGCTLKVPSGAFCAGLAVDETRGLVYVSVTLPGPTVSRNFIRVLKASNKCTTVCELEIPRCGPPLLGSEVLGLAFDACNERLFATFGHFTLPIKLSDPASCKLEPGTCCDKQLAGVWRGLAVLPGATLTHYGKACIGKGCPFCSSIGARPVGGMPVLGNQDFGFLVENGPAPSFGLLIVGFGRCTKGIGVPFLCGAIYPSLQPPTVFLGPVALQGKGQCLGTALAPLPLPADARFCGVTLCLEWVVMCGQLSGFGLSDTYELTIG